MPRYYFHIDDGVPTPDQEGTELENLSVAKCEAIRMTGRIICDAGDSFWDRAEWTMTVTDETGLTLFQPYVVGTEAAAAGLAAA